MKTNWIKLKRYIRDLEEKHLKTVDGINLLINGRSI